MSNTYTFPTKPAPVEPGQESNFGGLVNDANHNAMTGTAGAGIQTVDISASPVSSPATVADNAVTTLTTPLNATEITLSTVTNTLNICEVSTSMTTYFTLPTGQVLTIPLARESKLFLESNSGNATVSFFYTIV